uniref:Cyclin-like domain-containing protein n=1 Tax=Anopheles gambiae TaxID=7165 RepID=A0A1S4GDB4_ANOGA
MSVSKTITETVSATGKAASAVIGTTQSTPATAAAPQPVQRPYGKIVLTLENCLLPEVKLDQTPSQNDGLDRETETDLRILGCELIQTAGILLKLPQVAMATGQVLFQRFFYSKSFVRHSMEATAMSCICLASKIEEAPRRIRDVINVFHHIKQVRSQNFVGKTQSYSKLYLLLKATLSAQSFRVQKKQTKQNKKIQIKHTKTKNGLNRTKQNKIHL